MKKTLSLVLVLVMLLAQLVIPASAISVIDEWEDPYKRLDVKSVSVEVKKDLIENIDGDYLYPEYEKEQFFYDVYYTYAIYTVVYENGEVETGEQYDLYGDLLLSDTQEKQPWGLGKHTVTGVYRGFKFEFQVEVIENPVASIKAVAKKPLVEGWDAYTDVYYGEDGEAPPVSYTSYSVYDAEPYFTIKMKDGTVVKGTDEEIFNQTGYWTFDIHDQRTNPLKVGKNKVKFEYLGKAFECEVEILPNPYKSVTLKGENELYLAFEGIDKKDSYETKIVSAFVYDWNYVTGDYYAEITTDDEKIYDIVIYSDKDANGDSTLNKNVSIAIGPLVTNTLESCNYFKLAYESSVILVEVMDYYQLSEKMSGKKFEGYNAEKSNLNDIVALSAMIGAKDDNYDVTDKGIAYKLSVEEAQEAVKNVFGITDIDVKKSDFYKPLTQKIKVEKSWMTSYYYSDEALTFKDGKWVDTAKVFDAVALSIPTEGVPLTF